MQRVTSEETFEAMQPPFEVRLTSLPHVVTPLSYST